MWAKKYLAAKKKKAGEGVAAILIYKPRFSLHSARCNWEFGVHLWPLLLIEP